MITTVTPNPSVDRTLVVSGYRLGAIHRPQKLVVLPGGKGLNVARTIRRLGGTVQACAMLGGHNGRWIAEQLPMEGITLVAAWSQQETRCCTSIVDPETGQLTEIYEAGNRIEMEDWISLETAVRETLPCTSWMTLSGSLPPGAPPDGYARLLAVAGDARLQTVADIQAALAIRAWPNLPTVLKVNAVEAAEFLGAPVSSWSDAIGASRALRQQGIPAVVVTLGHLGAIAANSRGAWRGTVPAVEAVAAVGSGDAFLGGLVLALENGADLPEALRAALAAGTANATTLGPGMVEKPTADALLGQIHIRQILQTE
jgi:1-phosphofructokinase family hexose kinase